MQIIFSGINHGRPKIIKNLINTFVVRNTCIVISFQFVSSGSIFLMHASIYCERQSVINRKHDTQCVNNGTNCKVCVSVYLKLFY